jgi:hypothetical protein
MMMLLETVRDEDTVPKNHSFLNFSGLFTLIVDVLQTDVEAVLQLLDVLQLANNQQDYNKINLCDNAGNKSNA